MRFLWFVVFLSRLAGGALAAPGPAFALESKPHDPFFENFLPRQAPPLRGPVLKTGDRLAICGDSITEQKMYSRVMETYLTVCHPDLKIEVRQFGWSGEQAGGFLARMTNDCLRFKPSIATTCYGMNDHRYRAFEEEIGQKYRDKSTAIVQAFKANDVRPILGSPGCVSKNPEALNLSLCELRNIGIDIAEKERVNFADVFWPMLTAGHAGRQKYGTNYFIAGADGVHPAWAGSFVMAYAFLKAFGLESNVGTFVVDLKGRPTQVTRGHELLSDKDGEIQIQSRRYPFCATGDLASDNSIRSAMTLVPFNPELNRLTLFVLNGKAKSYHVKWGDESKSYTAAQLSRGVNLAEDFLVNPFSEAFAKVDAAVAAKQAYETKQIKEIFRNPEAKADLEGTVTKTEAERTALVEAIKKAFVPVTHTIRITPETEAKSGTGG